jgi:hybrid cluster-associated redox disulfide protein
MQPRLSLNITVKELMDRHPQLLRQFMDLGLLCVGCPTEAFHTLTDVAREYGLDPNQLLHQLQHAIEETVATKGSRP